MKSICHRLLIIDKKQLKMCNEHWKFKVITIKQLQMNQISALDSRRNWYTIKHINWLRCIILAELSKGLCFNYQLTKIFICLIVLKLSMECWEAEKIFSHIPTHQGLILVLVYLWYTNTEHDWRKNKIDSWTQKRTFNLYNIDNSGIKRKNTRIYPYSMTQSCGLESHLQIKLVCLRWWCFLL